VLLVCERRWDNVRLRAMVKVPVCHSWLYSLKIKQTMIQRRAVVDYDWLSDEGLDEAFCLTFARGSSDSLVLTRFGVDPESLRTLDGLAEALDGPFDPAVVAGELAGGWVFVLEDNGFEGSREEVLRAVSAGTEAVSVFTNVNGNARFCHAVDGVVRTQFDPCSASRRWGSDPDALLPLMHEVGMPCGQDDEWFAEGVDAALALAHRITGVPLSAARVAEPVLSGRLVPLLFDPPRGPSWMLREDHELMMAIESADRAMLRRVVAAEARRRAGDAGIAGHPLVAQALDEVERGQTRAVGDDSELGLLLRGLACESRAAGDSLALPTQRHLMTETERQQAFLRHSAGLAVQSALFPDPVRAAYQVLGWVAPHRDATRIARRADILRELRG